MNADLLKVVKRIVSEYGESILFDSKRINSFLLDLAQGVSVLEKKTLIKCLEREFARTLKEVSKEKRADCKQKLAERLYNEDGTDINLLRDAIELLATVLFAKESDEDYFLSGIAHSNKGDYGAAIADFTKAIELKEDARYYYWRFFVYGRKGDYEAAHRDKEKALKMDPKIEETIKVKEMSKMQDTFVDKAGKSYKIVEIGGLVWMAENLDYNAIGSEYYPKKCYKDGRTRAEYGKLYDWKTAKTACPEGWHLPSNDEWKNLVDAVGGDKIAGKKLKSKSGWEFNKKKNRSGNGECEEDGFNALPGGFRKSNGEYKDFDCYGRWWSATEVESDTNNSYAQSMSYQTESCTSDDYNKSCLFSVRYVKDHDLKLDDLNLDKEEKCKDSKKKIDVNEKDKEFGIHPIDGELQKAFSKRPFQIQEPKNAKIIFLSLDANWDKDIEIKQREYFKDTLDYLADGVKYWKLGEKCGEKDGKEVRKHVIIDTRILKYTKDGGGRIYETEMKKYVIHTPMLKEYVNEKVEDGKKYHEEFGKLGFSPDEWADKICFLDLLGVCTYGKSREKENKKEFERELKKHINSKYLEEVFNNPENIICIAYGVLKYLKEDIEKKLGKSFERFNAENIIWLSRHVKSRHTKGEKRIVGIEIIPTNTYFYDGDDDISEDIKIDRISDEDIEKTSGKNVIVHTHFSDSISNAELGILKRILWYKVKGSFW